jgi:hypothetical protein
MVACKKEEDVRPTMPQVHYRRLGGSAGYAGHSKKRQISSKCGLCAICGKSEMSAFVHEALSESFHKPS